MDKAAPPPPPEKTITPVRVAESGHWPDFATWSEAREPLRRLADATPLALLMVDAEGVVIGANPAAARLLGQPSPQLAGQRFNAFFQCRADAAFADQMRREGAVVDRRARLRQSGDGSVSFVDIFWRIFSRDGRELFLAFCLPALVQDLAAEHQEFLSELSHELRTPLQGIAGMVDLLLDSPLTRQQQDATAIIRNSAGFLTDVIDDVCDFANLKAGRLAPRGDPLDLHALLEETGAGLAAAAETARARLILQYRPADAPRQFIGDARRLHQLLRHLATHAIAATPDGRVVLRVEVVPAAAAAAPADRLGVVLSVIDNGNGLDDFAARYLSADLSAAVPPPPTSWNSARGLPIARILARMLGGRLTAMANAGRGATYRARLELAEDAERRDAPAPRPSLPGCRVLVVDTDLEERAALREKLEYFGCVVEEAAGGSEAAMRLRVAEAPPHVIVVDYRLGRTDAGLLIRTIKEDPDLGEIPVVGLASPGNLVEYRALPEGWLAAVLAKPARESELARGILAAIDPPATAAPWNAVEDDRFPAPVSALLIDDHPGGGQRIMRRLLNGYGCRVTEAMDARQAAVRLGGNRFDVVLADMEMPGLEEVFARLAAPTAGTDEVKPTRLVGLTVGADRLAGRYPSVRLDACLARPIEPAALRGAMQRLLF